MRRARLAQMMVGLACLLVASACQLKRTGPSLPPQSMAPPVVLESTRGPLDTQAAISRGPLVLVFYRGHW